jgi:mRNA-degrading endonuclease toxin of MazEF toxin-antitoxin module
MWVADCPKPASKNPDEKTNIQYGKRPIIIIGNEHSNRSDLLTVIKGSSRYKKLNMPTHVMIEGYGLEEVTVFMAEQVGPIDKKKLLKYIGQLDDEIMAIIDKALEIQTGLFEPFSIEYVKELIDDINEVDRFFTKYRVTEEESKIKNKRLKELEIYCAEYGYNYKMLLNKYLEYNSIGEVNLCG